MEWLHSAIEADLKTTGRLYRYNDAGTCYVLKFGKMAARDILRQCYYPESFSLMRKNILAEECINSYIGWRRSRTTESARN